MYIPHASKVKGQQPSAKRTAMTRGPCSNNPEIPGSHTGQNDGEEERDKEARWGVER